LSKSWGTDDLFLVLSLVSMIDQRQTTFSDFVESDLFHNVLCLLIVRNTLWDRSTYNGYTSGGYTQGTVFLVALRALLYPYNSPHSCLDRHLPSTNMREAYPQTHYLWNSGNDHLFLDLLFLPCSISMQPSELFLGSI